VEKGTCAIVKVVDHVVGIKQSLGTLIVVLIKYQFETAVDFKCCLPYSNINIISIEQYSLIILQ